MNLPHLGVCCAILGGFTVAIMVICKVWEMLGKVLP